MIFSISLSMNEILWLTTLEDGVERRVIIPCHYRNFINRFLIQMYPLLKARKESNLVILYKLVGYLHVFMLMIKDATGISIR